MNMQRLTIGFGALLIALGVISYAASDAASITALLPAFAGVPVVLAGLLMGQPGRRKPGLYAALVFVLLLVVGSLRGVGLLFGALGGDDDVTLAMIVQTIIVILGAIYLVFGVRTVMAERA